MLDERGDLPAPPRSLSWEAFDLSAGIHKVRQMTVEDVLDVLDDE